jgi:hypothetical protein
MCCLPLTAFLVQPDLRLQVLDAHLERGVNAGKAVGEGGDQGPVKEITPTAELRGMNWRLQAPHAGRLQIPRHLGLLIFFSYS